MGPSSEILSSHSPNQVSVPSELTQYELWLATGGKNKIEAAQSSYDTPLNTADPEKNCNFPEPSEGSVDLIAWLKTSAVLLRSNELAQALEEKSLLSNENQTGERKHCVVLGVDVSVEIDDQDLKKLIREMGYDEKRKLVGARAQAMQMYCNGQFHVVWKVACALQSSDGKIKSVGTIEFSGVYNPLDKKEVKKAFQDEGVLYRATRVPLAELADQYAVEMKVKDGELWKPVDFQAVYNIVARGLLSTEMWQQLITVQTQPEDDSAYYAHRPLTLAIS